MQFFIDSADVGEIKKALALGLCDGVTTNPSLVAKTGRAFSDVLKEIVALVPGPDLGGGHRDGRRGHAEGGAASSRSTATRSSSKVPLIVEGLRAVKVLTGEGDQDERHALLLGGAGAPRGQGGRDLRLAVRRPARRHLPGRHGSSSPTSCEIYRNYDFADEGARRLACATRCTCSRRRASARTSRRSRSASSSSSRSTRSPTPA